MKVLNLRCGNGHGFEGWFASEAEFQDQWGRGLVTCPACGVAQVEKLPSAPRLNLSGGRSSEAARAPQAPDSAGPTAPGGLVPAASAARLKALWQEAVHQVLQNTEDVGARFPEEARRIHYGEVPQRGIRGQATADDCAALADEGIEVMALPLPSVPKGTLQ